MGAGAAAIGLAATPTSAAGESTAWIRTLSGGGDTRLTGAAPDGGGGSVVAGQRGSRGFAANLGPGGATDWVLTVKEREGVRFSDVTTRKGRHAFVGRHTGDIQNDGYLALVEDGRVVQDRTYGAQQYNDDLHAVTALDDGFLLAGRTLDPNTRTNVGWAVRTGIAGTVTWSRAFTEGDQNVFLDAAVLDDGFVFAGYSDGQALVIETDESGERRRTNTYGGNDSRAHRCTAVLPATRGYYLTGYAEAGSESVGWVMHVDGTQQRVWRRTLGDGGARIEDMGAAGGAPFLAGEQGGAAWALRASESGAGWQRTFGAADRFEGTAALRDGAVFAGTRGTDGFVVKVGTPSDTSSGEATATSEDTPIPDAGETTTATDAESDPTRTATETDAGGGGDEPAPTAQNTSEVIGVPGFGVPAALLGAGAAGWAAVRRDSED